MTLSKQGLLAIHAVFFTFTLLLAVLWKMPVPHESTPSMNSAPQLSI